MRINYFEIFKFISDINLLNHDTKLCERTLNPILYKVLQIYLHNSIVPSVTIFLLSYKKNKRPDFP